MLQRFRIAPLFAVAFLLAPATSGTGAEIRVLNANALTVAMKELAAEFTRDTGNQVSFSGMSPGLVDQRIKAGEVYDLVINATDSVQSFEKQGKWRPGSRHPLARVGIGIAIRDGGKLDLSTVESTRKAILDAKTIMFSDSRGGGLSGINAQKVLSNLGLTDAVKAKTKLSKDLAGGQAEIAKGEVDLGLFNLSEIPRAPGVTRAGPVPAAVQVYINYDSAIPATNTMPEPALALLKYLQRPASRAVWDKAGLEVVAE
ncbi:MAG TPA: substrate-binding domain-containing protein [Xanthobacteraceae bacterium]|jgi:molybdate transport system substrate-binding protein